jgi:hypothetical protein
LDDHAKSIELSAEIPASGIREAFAILDYLTTGRKHPISKHIEGLRSGRYHPQKANVNAIERAAQAIVVGVLRAYMAETGARQSDALRQVVVAAKSAGISFSGTKDSPGNQIRMWDRWFSENKVALPDHFATQLRKTGDAQQILNVGAAWIWKHWAVPMPPT